MKCNVLGTGSVQSTAFFCLALANFYPRNLLASQRVSAAQGVCWLRLLFTSMWCSASRIKMHPVLVVAIHQEEQRHSRSRPFVPAFKQARGIDCQMVVAMVGRLLQYFQLEIVPLCYRLGIAT